MTATSPRLNLTSTAAWLANKPKHLHSQIAVRETKGAAELYREMVG
jgi:hypothetical protein